MERWPCLFLIAILLLLWGGHQWIFGDWKRSGPQQLNKDAAQLLGRGRREWSL
ncbi:hypothetical protein M011DRAFT_465174 [Sporormia fimetaria CBS 119925]|uniref:Uncharacterized protein n=1 Tax=Sporormia fimetaria CBS 119925 TaxID=1340428 RepID=A0A6A6VJW6_9PLEO|nr:hypothetical protein M011DRAFT_465174 [Sporormia fimetaria CBS 119925]